MAREPAAASHIDAVEEVPGSDGRRFGQIRRGGDVAVGDEVVLVGEGVIGLGAHHLRRQIEADGQIGERRDGERHGIGEDLGAGRNVDRSGSAKGDGMIDAGLDGRACRRSTPRAHR